jgi:SAM-dependent methyltransferase
VRVTGEYGQLDPFRGIEAAEIERVREMATLLEQRSQSAEEVAVRTAYLDLLAIQPGEHVLDVGCGSGIPLRDMARRVGRTGRAVGLEYSAAFLAVARDLSEQEGLSAWTELRQGDARALPFADGEFDLASAATVLRHIPGGDRAVAELARVVREGGRVAVFEGDTDGCLINHPDRALTRRIVASGTDNNNIDGQLARRLPGLLHEAGLEEIGVQAFTTVDRDPAGYYSQRCVNWAKAAARVGAISPVERDRWVDSLMAEQAAGRYLVAQVQILAWGRRPMT